METSTPLQFRQNPLIKLFKRLLRTQLGKKIAFQLGLRGFNRVGVRLIRANGQIEDLGFVYNSRVNKGAALQASLMSGSSLGSIGSPLPPIYIALSTSSLTAASGDTTLSGETSVSGLARAL